MSTRNHRHINAPRAPVKPGRGKKQERLDRSEPPGLPGKPAEMSWRDYLIMLLHVAAELEHCLMVEYLYAAYSLGGPGAAKHERMVHDWRDAILTVAREEMGHLICVQNLLLLVGGPVSFERDDYPWSSPFYPFDFTLAPFSLDSLACYVYAEMPKPETLEHAEDKRTVRDVSRMVKGLVHKATPTVGEIYETIIALVADREKIPDSMFDPDSYRYQATWDEWGRGYRPGTHQPYARTPDVPPPHERKTRVIVAQMATRTEALDVLRDVAGQGEAEHVRAGDKKEDSHFDRFARIFRAYQRILEKDPDWSPSLPIPGNPYAGEKAHAPNGTTPITSKVSVSWAGLFNIRYRMLLSMLTYMFRIPRDAPAAVHLRRPQMLARIFGEMYNMKAIAGILVRLPLGDPGDAARAGPPFQMPYSLTPPLPEANFWRLHLDLFDACAELANRLKAAERAGTPRATYLQAMLEIDRDSREWIMGILGGIDATRKAHG